MLKRILCLVLTLMMLPLPALATNVEDSIVIGMQAVNTYELRPLLPLERDIISVYSLIYESLVTIDDNGIPQPHLAEKWEETGDGKTGI